MIWDAATNSHAVIKLTALLDRVGETPGVADAAKAADKATRDGEKAAAQAIKAGEKDAAALKRAATAAARAEKVAAAKGGA